MEKAGKAKKLSTRTDALDALTERGVHHPEQLADCGTPDEIIAACHRWDRQDGVTTGLLVKWIRDGDFPPPEPANPYRRLKTRFEDYARKYPAGTVVESSHYRPTRVPDSKPDAPIWDRVRHVECDGTVRITSASFPTILCECDKCRYECAIPARLVHALDQAAHPIAF